MDLRPHTRTHMHPRARIHTHTHNTYQKRLLLRRTRTRTGSGEERFACCRRGKTERKATSSGPRRRARNLNVQKEGRVCVHVSLSVCVGGWASLSPCGCVWVHDLTHSLN